MRTLNPPVPVAGMQPEAGAMPRLPQRRRWWCASVSFENAIAVNHFHESNQVQSEPSKRYWSHLGARNHRWFSTSTMCLARKASNGSTPCLPTSTRQSKPEAFSTSVFKWVRRSGPMDTQKRARVSFQPRRALLQPTISERAFAWPPPSCRSAELPVLSPTCKQNGWDVATTCSTTIAATLLTLCASVWALATFQNGHTVTWWIVLFCRACGVIASFVDFVVPSPLVSYLFFLSSFLPPFFLACGCSLGIPQLVGCWFALWICWLCSGFASFGSSIARPGVLSVSVLCSQTVFYRPKLGPPHSNGLQYDGVL